LQSAKPAREFFVGFCHNALSGYELYAIRRQAQQNPKIFPESLQRFKHFANQRAEPMKYGCRCLSGQTSLPLRGRRCVFRRSDKPESAQASFDDPMIGSG
jgi:hypothetical protein